MNMIICIYGDIYIKRAQSFKYSRDFSYFMVNWQFWKRKRGNPHNFTEEERDDAAKVREARREIQLLKIEREGELHNLKMQKQKLELQAEIADLKADLEPYVDSEDDSPEDRTTSDLIKLFAPMLLKNQNVAAPASVATPIPTVAVQQHLNDDTLIALWEKTPQQYKLMAKTMPDETVKSMIKQQMPNIDDDSINRAVGIIRSN